MAQHSECPWWDGTNPDSFFPSVYRIGDDSIEGHVHGLLLDVHRRTARECDMVERLLALVAGSKILDCPCGYGRHSLDFAARGHHVTGVDLCPAFIHEARVRAGECELPGSCHFVQADMRNLPATVSGFDICINLFLSFGFFSDSDNRQVLRQFRRALRPGGYLLIHTDVNPDRARAGLHMDRATRRLRNGGTLQIHETYDPETQMLDGTWMVSRPGAVYTREYSIRIYTHDEMSALLREAGFRNVCVEYPFTASPLRDIAPQEVVYVARS